ncbi:MAG: biotin-dependent carboxyltransferase family protein, partial [Catalinimonas sp.]
CNPATACASSPWTGTSSTRRAAQMIEVRRPGLLTTVQDSGRPRHQAAGVSPGGAVDAAALRLANCLVGNPPGTAALEITLAGPTLRFQEPSLVAVAGAPLPVTLAGREVRPHRPYRVAPGDVLWCGRATAGVRTYLGVAGGIDVPHVLDSASTDLRAGFGGLAGRALQTGDVLAVGLSIIAVERFKAVGWSAEPFEAIGSEPLVIDVLPGPEWEGFTEASRRHLETVTFVVTPRSNRTGCVLAGPKLSRADDTQLLSTAVPFGTVQVPPGGQPIVLLADRPPTGGYPRPWQVVTADFSKLAQAPPGQTLSFRRTTLADAHRCLREQHQHEQQRAHALRWALRNVCKGPLI